MTEIEELRARIVKLEDALALAVKAAMTERAAGYRAGFDDAFVRGVRALGDLWSSLLKSIFTLKEGFNEIELIHDNLFNAIEGRAEDAPSLFDVPAEHWIRATGRWADIQRTPPVGEEKA